MKTIQFICFTLFLTTIVKIHANSVSFNYVGDGKPVQIEIESKASGNQNNTDAKNKDNSFLNQFVKSQITFNFEEKSGLGVLAKFEISQVDTELKIKGETLYKQVIKLQKNIISEKFDRVLKKKIIHYVINVKFENFNETYPEFKKGMSDLDFSHNEVIFHTAKLQNPKNYFLILELSRKTIFKNEKIIFKKILNINDADFTQEQINEERFKNVIDLKRITKGEINLDQDLKIKVIFKSTQDVSGIINPDQNMPLIFEKTIKNL